MKTTILARKSSNEPDDVIAEGWTEISYIPVIGDRVNCFGGAIAKVNNRELRYDDDKSHLTVILEVELEPAQSDVDSTLIPRPRRRVLSEGIQP